MTITANGTTMRRVYANGTELQDVTANGTVVFRRYDGTFYFGLNGYADFTTSIANTYKIPYYYE